MVSSGQKAEGLQQNMQADFKTFQTDKPAPNNPRPTSGHAAVWQARLIMLVMINIAQLWILAATDDAALARHNSVLIPLVVASGVCLLVTLSIIRWWRPKSGTKTSTGYVRSPKPPAVGAADL
jgi:hypothetical protein